jgi:hypothetical protein
MILPTTPYWGPIPFSHNHGLSSTLLNSTQATNHRPHLSHASSHSSHSAAPSKPRPGLQPNYHRQYYSESHVLNPSHCPLCPDSSHYLSPAMQRVSDVQQAQVSWLVVPVGWASPSRPRVVLKVWCGRWQRPVLERREELRPEAVVEAEELHGLVARFLPHRLSASSLPCGFGCSCRATSL